MVKRKVPFSLVCLLVLALLVACTGSSQSASSGIAALDDGQAVVGTATSSGTGSTAASVAGSATSSAAATAVTPAASVAEAMAENSDDHDGTQDRSWDSSAAVDITFHGNSITVDGDGATANGSQLTITSAGTYNLSGSLVDGQIIVNTDDSEVVRLVLNGVDIRSSTSAPIYILAADETIIYLTDNTENYLSDADSYVLDNAEEDEPNAALFSMADLTIDGNGSLTVEGHCNDGIASKDGLVITGGTIVVNSVDDGIRGKDYLVVKIGTITVSAQGDGFKSDNEEDATKGYVLIEDGMIDITAAGDAIDAQTDVMIAAGQITLSSGGGSNGRIDESSSAKGIKASVSVTIDSGTFAIDSADDAIHSNGSLVINGGSFIIASGDDALHADSTLDVNGGEISITNSFEGLESAAITINDGQIDIIASDDGLNVTGGNDGSGLNLGPGFGGGPGGRPGGGGGQDTFASTGNYFLNINGGYITLDTDGDGIDVNGSIEMTDGVVIVNGPTENMNGALDYDVSFTITGGLFVAAGSAGMAQAPDESSTQHSVLLNFSSTLRAGTLVHIQTGDGDAVLTFSPSKEYQSITFSSAELTDGSTYEVYYGGSSTGAVVDGLYQDGAYTAGTQYTSFTASQIVTWVGGRSR